MPSQTVVPVNPPTVITDDTMKIPTPWGGKAGDISFNKIKIPPGLTLHKINIHYENEGGNCRIVGSPTHTTYIMSDTAFSSNIIPIENIPMTDFNSGNYISYIDSSYVNKFINEHPNEITYTVNEDDSIITAKGSLYSSSSWESATTFYVKSAETVDTKNS